MLSKFLNKTLKIGAPVTLSPESRYVAGREGNGPGPSNPVGIVGRVTDQEASTTFVKWPGNIFSTDYRSHDRDLIAEGEPGFMEVDF